MGGGEGCEGLERAGRDRVTVGGVGTVQHGLERMAIGTGARLAVGGGWRLAVGGWWRLVVGGGWGLVVPKGGP